MRAHEMPVSVAPPGVALWPERRKRVRTVFLVALAIPLLHFLWLSAYRTSALTQPEADAYTVRVERIAGGSSAAPSVHSSVTARLEPEDDGAHRSPRPGIPLLVTAAWTIGGLEAALLLTPLFASATVWLVFLLARRFAGERLAVLVAVIVALIPAVKPLGLDTDARVIALFFVVSGGLALLRFGDTQARSVGLLGGVLLGLAPAFRAPEAVMGVIVAAGLLRRVGPIRHAWPAIAGAAGPLGAQAVHFFVTSRGAAL